MNKDFMFRINGSLGQELAADRARKSQGDCPGCDDYGR
jgi:hypothetical protein